MGQKEVDNLVKWTELLKGKSNYEVFKIIWDPKRDLTPKQRQALVKFHEKINIKTELTPYDKNWWKV